MDVGQTHQEAPPDLPTRFSDRLAHWVKRGAASQTPGASLDLDARRAQLERAPDSGDVDAMFNLGLLYADMQPPNLDASCHWYERAADAGCVQWPYLPTSSRSARTT
jgi:TPR repeat protein